MPIAFDEVTVDVREPPRDTAPAAAAATPAPAELQAQIEQALLLRAERQQRLQTD
jgi:hypothetical protein